eukprot:3797642-Rhodomonas_salina.1
MSGTDVAYGHYSMCGDCCAMRGTDIAYVGAASVIDSTHAGMLPTTVALLGFTLATAILGCDACSRACCDDDNATTSSHVGSNHALIHSWASADFFFEIVVTVMLSVWKRLNPLREKNTFEVSPCLSCSNPHP